MFSFIYNNKALSCLIIAVLLAVGATFKLTTGFLAGGFFIIAILLTGLIYSAKLTYFLAGTVYIFSLVSNLVYNVPRSQFIIQETTLALMFIFAAYTGSQVKKYIQQLTKHHKKITELNKDLILAFVNTMEAKNKYLCSHSLNVSFYARQIAEQMQLPPEECKKVCLAGLFHDIGKIGISETILDKAGRLTDSEWDLIKTHPEVGAKILKNIPTLREITDIIKYHHLYYNGKGYPDGPRKDDIPLGARIIAVADAFDAMTSKRPYSDARSIEEACEELKRCSGTQFDPDVVSAFLKSPLLKLPRQHADIRAETLT
ncbi:MAG: HD-GYP domain-containing protein [Thermoanaerobacteraceae bacterium]|nr:HD-GYP domain-containing protein [Thermoanaerobacteraceae bacterium]